MSEYNVTDGRFWHTQLPDGQWAVLWSHPALGDWNCVVARFTSEDRAETYCNCENDCLEPTENRADVAAPELPELIAPPSRLARLPAPKRSMLQEYSDRLQSELSELFATYPDGVRTSHLMERYGSSYAAAVEAMKWLHHNGQGQWVYRQGMGGAKVLLPPDAEVNASDLTERQDRVFEAMRDMADEHGCVTEPYIAISAKASVSLGSVPAILYALESKGYLMLAKPAGRNGTSPAVYQIIAETEAKQAAAT